jgi:hypothetical protein
MTATGNRRAFGRIWLRRPAEFALICLLALLVVGHFGTALCEPGVTGIRLAQVTNQDRSVQTKSQNGQSAPGGQSASGASEPADNGNQPSDRSAPRRPSAPQQEFKPSEQIDVDKAVDFPADI